MSAGRHGRDGLNDTLGLQASGMTIGDMLRLQARLRPDHPAVRDDTRCFSFAAFHARSNRLAQALLAMEIGRGDRVAILSENRIEYLELLFAAGKIGAIVAALNWRLSDPELRHCIDLAGPRALLVSPSYMPAIARLGVGGAVIGIGEEYETLLARASVAEPRCVVETEDGLMILYTSGTTGMPKGALISHRAQIARTYSDGVDFDLTAGDNFVAWAPMYHMASAEQSLSVLCLGGTVHVVPGYDVDRLIHAIRNVPQWWLLLMPGMVGGFLRELRRQRNFTPAPIKVAGAMADLVPPHEIAEVTALLRAPYANTFGSTETGLPPFSAGRFAPGVVPVKFGKIQSSCCHVRLVGPDDNEVPDGEPGEVAIRSPTLFSGYWNAPQTNAHDFRNGWFHMGDVCRRNPDGTVDFVDRVKYLIKSGGENIYPAEIERVLLADPRIADAVVVRRADTRWGEVPVAFIAAREDGVTAGELLARCRAELAGYKQPKEIRFIRAEDLPRSTTGKIQRHEVEKWLRAEGA